MVLRVFNSLYLWRGKRLSFKTCLNIWDWQLYHFRCLMVWSLVVPFSYLKKRFQFYNSHSQRSAHTPASLVSVFSFQYIPTWFHFRTVNLWCHLHSLSNLTSVPSRMTSSRSPCSKERRRTKIKTRRGRLWRWKKGKCVERSTRLLFGGVGVSILVLLYCCHSGALKSSQKKKKSLVIDRNTTKMTYVIIVL